jgi:hypothetical protein
MNNLKIDIAVLGLDTMEGTHIGVAKASMYVDKIYGCKPDMARAVLSARNLESIPPLAWFQS